MPHVNPHLALARQMVENQLRRRGLADPAVLAAMLAVPRHLFVPDLPVEDAYADRALPTAEGQTISQPYIVALMTRLLGVAAGQSVLEIGAGSGYQAAVLAHLGARVISLERSESLAARARAALERAGAAGQVRVITADGTLGWSQEAPYHRILVTAAAPRLPSALRDQLADGGRIVIPLGDREEQVLAVFDRRGDDWFRRDDAACRFVPLVGADGWSG